jgi:5-methylthioadenosine/S-adenosylhomocysteine deaminase
VHNPVSNLKLGSGVAPVRRLLEAGVNVALGTDGLTCNDALDMFEVTKLAAILSCVATSDDARWLSPSEALRMATLGGARANVMADVGEIKVGGKADLVTLAPDASAFVPRSDAVAQTVYSARSGDVRHVLVDGALVVRDRECQHFDLAAVHEHVLDAAARFWTEAEPTIQDNLRLRDGVDAAYRKYAHDVHARPVYRIIDDHPGAHRA